VTLPDHASRAGEVARRERGRRGRMERRERRNGKDYGRKYAHPLI